METFEILKEKVYEEVAQTSSYTGDKMTGDEGAYERIFTTDEDRSQLERFWRECCAAFSEKMKRFLASDAETAGGHRFELELSRSFDRAMLPAMKEDLFSYFVMGITAKWYGFCNKNEAGEYATAAASLLEGIHRKACHKRKPTRPTY